MEYNDLLGNWYEEHGPAVRNRIFFRLSCSEQKVDDLTNEVFIRALRHLKKGGDTIRDPKSWLLRITNNVCNDDFSAEGKHPTCSTMSIDDDGASGLAFEPESQNLPVEMVVEMKALFEEALYYLHQLSSEEQTAITLRYLEGWKLKQIAEAIKRSVPVVQKRIRSGLEKLRVQMVKDGF